MTDNDKLSLGQAALYVGIPEETLAALQRANFIEAETWIGSTPIFLRGDLRRLKELRREPVDPVQLAIRERREAFEGTLSLVTRQLKDLQEECTHPKAVKTNKANTGNWDQSQDCYWKDCTCPDCGKRWTEDQ